MSDLPPPEMPAQAEPHNMCGRLAAIRDATLDLERSLAGYTQITESLACALHGPQQGQRKKLPPIFSYKASADGVHPIEVNVDLRKVGLESLQYIMAPVANLHAAEMAEALSKILKYAAAMDAEVRVATGKVTAAATPQPAAIVAVEPYEEVTGS